MGRSTLPFPSSFLLRRPTAAIDAPGDRLYPPARLGPVRRDRAAERTDPTRIRDDGGRRMGVALGGLTLALAAVAAAPEAGRGGAPIKYTVRFVEAEGLAWRDAVYSRLTPVTRQGAATVWTAPSEVAKHLHTHAMKSPSAQVHQVPTVIARPGTPAHITTTRASFPLVTQVAWNGDDRPAEARRETVRTGSAATMAGRKLDQGVLVQMVLKD